MGSKKELIDKQADFWVWMAGGSTLIAACEAVGVDRRTGRHWRQATGGRIPRKRPAPSGRFLSLEERLRVADLHLAGEGVRAIATELGRSPSTVSRELTRNGPAPGGRGRYSPYAAHKRAELAGRRPKASKFDDAELQRPPLDVQGWREPASRHVETVRTRVAGVPTSIASIASDDGGAARRNPPAWRTGRGTPPGHWSGVAVGLASP